MQTHSPYGPGGLLRPISYWDAPPEVWTPNLFWKSEPFHILNFWKFGPFHILKFENWVSFTYLSLKRYPSHTSSLKKGPLSHTWIQKRYPFRAEHRRIANYMEYPPFLYGVQPAHKLPAPLFFQRKKKEQLLFFYFSSLEQMITEWMCLF